MKYACHLPNGGSAPATPGFNAVTPEPLFNGAAHAAPAVPAAESTLGSHPCVALSSAQVLPEWINHNLAGNRFAANGDNPLNFVSHSRGSLQIESALYRRKGRALTNFERTLPVPQSELAQEILKDPYNFDFLSLGPEILERDLERGLIEHLRDLILEMGKGFSFVGSQYRLEIGGGDGITTCTCSSITCVSDAS